MENYYLFYVLLSRLFNNSIRPGRYKKYLYYGQETIKDI